MLTPAVYPAQCSRFELDSRIATAHHPLHRITLSIALP